MAQGSPEHDLFVCFAEQDAEWVHGYLLDALRASKLSCYTELAFKAGLPQIKAIEDAVAKSRKTCLVVSPYLFAIHQLIRLALLALWHLPIGYRTTKDWPVVMRNRHHLLVVRFRYMPRMLKRTATVCPTKRNGSWQLALAQLVPDSTAMMIHCFHILRHVT